MTEEELPKAIQEYYDQILLEASPDNTLGLRFMEYIKNRDPSRIPYDFPEDSQDGGE